MVFSFGERVSVCSPGCPGTHCVRLGGVASNSRDLPTSVTQNVGIKDLLTVFKQASIISKGEETHLHHKAPPGVNRCALQRGLNDKEETTDRRT